MGADTVTESPTYGPVDYLNDTIRYTTLDAVKTALGIDDTANDASLTTAIISLETMIDSYLGRSFPDTGDNPEIAGIPQQVVMASTVGAMEIYKLLDAPSGAGGADTDGFIGLYEPGAAARNAFNLVRPMLSGLKIQWGCA